MPQTENQKIRSRLRSYERKLQKEKKEHGFYRDGAGKRYQIGPHYMLLGDNDGALAAFEWFEKEFPDDIGVPDHYLCWSLALHRAGNEIGAARKLLISRPSISRGVRPASGSWGPRDRNRGFPFRVDTTCPGAPPPLYLSTPILRKTRSHQSRGPVPTDISTLDGTELPSPLRSPRSGPAECRPIKCKQLLSGLPKQSLALLQFDLMTRSRRPNRGLLPYGCTSPTEPLEAPPVVLPASRRCS